MKNKESQPVSKVPLGRSQTIYNTDLGIYLMYLATSYIYTRISVDNYTEPSLARTPRLLNVNAFTLASQIASHHGWTRVLIESDSQVLCN